MAGRLAAVRVPPAAGPVIERVSPDDLTQLACEVGPAPSQVGAVLTLDAGPEFDLGAAMSLIADRVVAVPRLRQRITRVPVGCGRMIWVDDPDFDAGCHLQSVTCPPPGDEAALLELAADIAARPLPRSRPLWSATFVTGLADRKVAVVVVFHHVLADGIGGLAVLASLVDGMPGPAPAPFPRPAPSARQLAGDAAATRLRAVAGLIPAVAELRSAFAELNLAGAVAPKTSLNRPTGASRRIMVTRADLHRVIDCAHAHGATVNDVVLTAVTRALSSLLTQRGEALDNVVASVLVAGRTSTTSGQLGNHIGVMPVRLPVRDGRSGQLQRIATATKAHKVTQRGASAALLGPGFRALAALRIVRWFVNHQRFVNIFVTNLRGPESRLSFAGATVADVLPITMIAGNVTLSFGVMSYAGSLTIAVVADPRCHRDLDALTAALQSELDSLALDAELWSAKRANGPGGPGSGRTPRCARTTAAPPLPVHADAPGREPAGSRPTRVGGSTAHQATETPHVPVTR